MTDLLATRASGVTLDTGLLQWIGAGVWAFAVRAIWRGINAKSRVQKELSDDRTGALSVLHSGHLLAVLQEIVLFVGTKIDWTMASDELGQPTDRVPGLLSRVDLVNQRQRLLQVGADGTDLDRLQDQIVTHCRRQCIAAVVFLLSWGYLLFWSAEKGVALPTALTATVFGMACVAVGFWIAEAVGERAANDTFAALHRKYEGTAS